MGVEISLNRYAKKKFKKNKFFSCLMKNKWYNVIIKKKIKGFLMSNEVVKYHNDLNTIIMRKWSPEEMNFFFTIIAKVREQGTKLMKFNSDEMCIRDRIYFLV